MKSPRAIFRITLLVSAFLWSGHLGFSQATNHQRAPQGVINPANGLPIGASGPAAIDFTTGLPIPAKGAEKQSASVGHLDPLTGLPGSGTRPGQIDPATGLSLPPRGAEMSTPDLDNPAFAAYRILEDAKDLTSRRKYDEALGRFLSYYDQSRTNAAVLLNIALEGWVELGRRYPKAKQALMGIRDHHTTEFVEDRGNSRLFQELAGINGALGEGDATYALFEGLEQSDPVLARDCYLFLEPALMERGKYETCARYLGDTQVRFEIAQRMLRREQAMAQRVMESRQKMAEQAEKLDRTNGWPQNERSQSPASGFPEKPAIDHFVHSVDRLIEILVATGRKPEAEHLRDQAVAVLDDVRLRLAISDAEARIRAARAAPRPDPAPMVMHPQFVENSTLFGTNFITPQAAIERWSPALESGKKPDLMRILSEANDLAAHNHYEESLQRHLWYHNHALEYDPEGQRGVRLSFALRDWVELGRSYPTARQALREVRDRDIHAFAEGRGSAGLFKDIAAINEQWSFSDTTCRLFEFVKQQNPELAKNCYGFAEGALMKKGEYALCFGYIGDYEAKFAGFCQQWERQKEWEDHTEQTRHEQEKTMEDTLKQLGKKVPGLPARSLQMPEPPKTADKMFVDRCRGLIEVLVGTGHRAEAEKIRGQALEQVQDTRLKSAISDAEERVAQHR